MHYSPLWVAAPPTEGFFRDFLCLDCSVFSLLVSSPLWRPKVVTWQSSVWSDMVRDSQPIEILTHNIRDLSATPS